MSNEIKGYKVFESDWTCRGKKYECPGMFEEDVMPVCCDRGMHFCVNLVDCFNYYVFNPKNKVAEVIALGEVDTEGNKSCTNKLKIVREIPWEEVLRLVNTGKANAGLRNSGDRNSGDWNSGDRNSGDWNSGSWNSGSRNSGSCNSGSRNSGNQNSGAWNSGDRNSGSRNSGDRNSGSRNSGDWNSGDCNSGSWNSGSCNSGSWNSGDRNSGDWNSGDWNSGSCNSGSRNSGDWNSGDCNSGDWNKTNFSSGCFNTEEANIMLFNKMSDWTYRKWLDSDARRLLNGIPRRCTKWVIDDDMTEQEKADHPSYNVTGGYLKTIDKAEEVQRWWDDLSTDEREIIRAIPNFDPDIFKECTGIDVKG